MSLRDILTNKYTVLVFILFILFCNLSLIFIAFQEGDLIEALAWLLILLQNFSIRKIKEEDKKAENE